MIRRAKTNLMERTEVDVRERGRPTEVGREAACDAPPSRRGLWIGAGLVVSGAVVTLLTYLLLDEPMKRWLLAHPNNWHRVGWVDAFRQLGKAYIPVWLVLLWSCVTNRWRSTIVTLAALALVGVSVCSLKAVVPRRRPNDRTAISRGSPAPDAHNSWEREVSFPSGDTAAAFAVAAALAFSTRRRWTAILLAAAGAVGLLRITSLVHYPSDVLAGTIIGVTAGCWAVRWTERRTWVDRFQMGRPRRILLGGLLVLLAPISPYIGMKPLWVFFRFYAVAIAALLLTGTMIYRNIRQETTSPLRQEPRNSNNHERQSNGDEVSNEICGSSARREKCVPAPAAARHPTDALRI